MIVKRLMNSAIINLFIAVLIITMIIGLMPVEKAYAQELGVKIPYSQKWTNDSDLDPNNTFKYRLTSSDAQSPMPAESENGHYDFKIKGNDKGELDLTFSFNKPGYYNYKVTPITKDRGNRYTLDKTEYEIVIMVVNGSSGLKVGTIAIEDPETGEKYDSLSYNQSYRYKSPGPGPEPGPNPDTGDDVMLWPYGTLFIAAFGSMLAIVIREYVKKRLKKTEDKAGVTG